jgi:hypothetical protein
MTYLGNGEAERRTVAAPDGGHDVGLLEVPVFKGAAAAAYL